MNEKRKVSPRIICEGVAALALIALAPLACAPAVACPQLQVAEGAPDSPLAPQRVEEAKFDWPVRGSIVIECWSEDKEKITIAAGNGAEVRAAQAGIVMYAGVLEGFGSLVAIRHPEGLVSATYGDIGGLRVKRNDLVEQGQVVATMQGSRESAGELRFEVRRAGRPVDPRAFMVTDEPALERGGDRVSAR